MSVEVTIRFEDPNDADEFLRRFEHREVPLRASIVGESADVETPEPPKAPSYHDVFITTRELKRKRISDLPFGFEVTVNRVGGWCLWDTSRGTANARLLAGEYSGRKRGLRVDVSGHVIVDSLTKKEK